MADNTTLPGTGESIASDDIGGVKYQRVKISIGADGAAADLAPGQVLMAASVPVVVASDQADINVSLDGEAVVLGAGVAAIGKLAANSGVDIGDVDVTSSALPTGASTAANQTTIIGHVDGIEALLGTMDADTSTLAGAVAGTEVQVDIVGALPAGTATIGATLDAGPGWTSSYLHTASADATGSVDVTAAPTGGQKIVIDDIILSVDTAMWVLFEEETSGTDIIKLYMAANSSAQVTPRGRIKLATADKKLRMDASVAGNIAVTVVYHSEA